MAIIKGSPNPECGSVAGWLAGPDGQKAYDQVGRGSPFVKESVKWKLIQKWASKTVFEGWDRPDYEPGLIKKNRRGLGFSHWKVSRQGELMLDGKLRIAPTCHHVLHLLLPVMSAHEMNFFTTRISRPQMDRSPSESRR
jgi:hypothetical protein